MILRGLDAINAYLKKQNKNDILYGVNVVSDHDEDFVFNALFDVPNML